jgi:hypothetical protein
MAIISGSSVGVYTCNLNLVSLGSDAAFAAMLIGM